MSETVMADYAPLHQRPAVRQFVKFCLVGASSTLVDLGVLFLLHYTFRVPVLLARTISFSLAVTNGFFWNQRWTFRAVGHRAHHEQYAMFFGVNLVGFLLNAGIMMGLIRLFTGAWSQHEVPKPVLLGATIPAIIVVTSWNFFANKHWTFKKSR